MSGRQLFGQHWCLERLGAVRDDRLGVAPVTEPATTAAWHRGEVVRVVGHQVDHIIVIVVVVVHGLAKHQAVTQLGQPLRYLMHRRPGEHEDAEPDHQHHERDGQPLGQQGHERRGDHEADESPAGPHRGCTFYRLRSAGEGMSDPEHPADAGGPADHQASSGGMSGRVAQHPPREAKQKNGNSPPQATCRPDHHGVGDVIDRPRQRPPLRRGCDQGESE